MKTSIRRKGFTLLELLVVIGLMGLVSTLGTTLFFKMTDAWNATRQRAELDAEANKTFDSLRQDLEQIVSPRLAGVSLAGLDRTAQEARYWNQSLGDDELSFPVLEPVGHSGNTVRCVQVRYYIDRSGESDTVMRELRDFGRPATEAVNNPLAQNVVWMDLEFLGADGQWAAAWEAPTLPKAVRVSLTMVDANSREQVTRKSVFPVRVD